MATRNEIVDLLLVELGKYGIKAEVEPRRRHEAIIFMTPAGKRMVIVSRSVSDRRAQTKARCGLRRILRQDGIELKKEG